MKISARFYGRGEGGGVGEGGWRVKSRTAYSSVNLLKQIQSEIQLEIGDCARDTPLKYRS